MKLSDAQEKLLQKMAKGDKAICFLTFSGCHDHWTLSSIHGNTIKALFKRKLIRQNAEEYGCSYTITALGRAAVEGEDG